MQCQIITPGQSKNFGNVLSITLPALDGEMELLAGHAECFIELRGGAAVAVDNEKITLPPGGGVCHVKNDAVTIVA